jgi:hypothetical protein
MFNGNRVIDTDGHVMEPNDLYDRYLEAKFKPDLEDLKTEAARCPSQFFFGLFHQLNTGRPLGVPHPDQPLMRTGRNPRGEKPERLDEHYELMPEYVPFLRRKPSEVIRSENFFISCDPDEETPPFVANFVGAEHIIYASDYPHFDGRFPDTVKLSGTAGGLCAGGAADDPVG